jgi:hypothetical protein
MHLKTAMITVIGAFRDRLAPQYGFQSKQKMLWSDHVITLRLVLKESIALIRLLYKSTQATLKRDEGMKRFSQNTCFTI